jgi:hypothetical protein
LRSQPPHQIEETIMTRLTGPRKFDWTDPRTYLDDEPPSNPYSPAKPPNIPGFLYNPPDRDSDWPPFTDPVPYYEYGWPPKAPEPPTAPIEVPAPDRPPMQFGPTPSRIVRAGSVGELDGTMPQPLSPVQNLTMQTLRMKGVPEADIGAAINDPVRMQQLLNQLYGGRSAIASGSGGSGFGRTVGRDITTDQPDQTSMPTRTPDNYLPFGWSGLPPLRR